MLDETLQEDQSPGQVQDKIEKQGSLYIKRRMIDEQVGLLSILRYSEEEQHV